MSRGLGVSTEVTTSAQLIASPTRPFTGLSWDGGNELRIYHLDPRNILQEYVYSARSGYKGWEQGTLHKLGIILKPDSPLSAIRMLEDNIRIYYQVPESGFIQVLCYTANSWVKGRTLAKATKGSSIAVTVYLHPKGEAVHVYYQDLALHLREQVWSPIVCAWVAGTFDAGVQPHGTQISATTSDDDTHIRLSWKGINGQIVSSKRSKLLGWGSSARDYGREQFDGRG